MGGSIIILKPMICFIFTLLISVCVEADLVGGSPASRVFMLTVLSVSHEAVPQNSHQPVWAELSISLLISKLLTSCFPSFPRKEMGYTSCCALKTIQSRSNHLISLGIHNAGKELDYQCDRFLSHIAVIFLFRTPWKVIKEYNLSASSHFSSYIFALSRVFSLD